MDDIQLVEEALDDKSLLARIKNIVMGDVQRDLEGETVEEQSKFVIETIARQLSSNTLSREAIGYLVHCFERSLDPSIDTLDEAFYLRTKKSAGGQKVAAHVQRAVVRAYLSFIRKATYGIEVDSLTGEEMEIAEVPSRSVLKQAEFAAFIAYREAVGKDDDSYGDSDKKINQTIKPMLKELLVLR
ncbi:hypothetical protein [Undibacterium flavidum]|uniref:Uncharacterized protein n=1 Tax=Undibacterium flavidum TaxID=2762297 RepID=A0ABR6YDJ2_9BURK|nr:hypothetical protein [Undibacterium flavidum]MBC3874603.1 hypothetical protein [Undibacterium flavidum]